jgi:hypothetical protein
MMTLWHETLLTNISFYVQELKDLMVKADGITRLMERGYRVKVSLFSFQFCKYPLTVLFSTRSIHLISKEDLWVLLNS